jgi:aspartate/methionine/tyrosine aminotransferase
MNDLLLAKPNLPEGWIDTTIGEPHLVRENLLKVFQISGELNLGFIKKEDLIYPNPVGYKPLVEHLEAKHKAPVIITNGAKQALGACFYALRKKGYDYCGMKSPYWALIPPLATMHGLTMIEPGYPHPDDKVPYLLLAPNNPDGHCESEEQLKKISQQFKDNNLPLIHDAAYYTNIYLPATYTLPAIGDVQIYSISKMFGLSGLRIGYVVCHNPEYYKLIIEYMEAMTVGVSISSQTWLYQILEHRLKSYPSLAQRFEGTCSLELEHNKKLCLKIDPEILEVPSNLLETAGMFGWFKVGPKADFKKAKINVIDGALFGGPGMIRMNLALLPDQMEEVVRRLSKEGE